MTKAEVGRTKQRGDYEETLVHDVTRVGNPIAAKILKSGDDYLVVPENDMYPVVVRENLSAAVSFVDQIIPDESSPF